MKLQDVKSIGILGAGVMGGGIAQCAIQAGQKVILRDLNDEILERTKSTILDSRFGFKKAIELGKMTQEQMDKAMSLLTLTTKQEDVKDCDIIIEAIGGGEGGRLEDKPLKLRVFGELDKQAKKGAIFASNTSMFTIADLAEATERKPQFVGFHLFSPANIMKLVEVTSTKDTLPEVAELMAELAKSWGKTPIMLKDVAGDKGFIGNRIMAAVRREAMEIIKEGVGTAEDINTAMTLGFRWPAGPMPTRGAPGARTGWK